MLPQEFKNRMEEMLQEEYPAFIESYEKPRYQSLRINTLKADAEMVKGQVDFHLKQIPWAKNGFYYEQEDYPGKHPYHEAGVYYIQEPSAMAPVEYLGAMPGDKILDLCAAPGGKSTQIASYMAGKGILVSNEIHPARAKILSENIERLGIKNAVVTNESPQKLAEKFENYFDRILVDAPCSGEGMFRKNEDAGNEWSLENVAVCAERDDTILDCAASMLRPGGRIVFSTCTFAPSENEGSIARFLLRNPDFSVIEVLLSEGMKPGVPAWSGMEEMDERICTELKKTIRLWPHYLNGEGHYLAVLQKSGSVPADYQGYVKDGLEKSVLEKECKEYIAFRDEYIQIPLEGGLLKFGDQLYLMPDGMPSLKGLKVLRPGLHLGTMKKNRFEPSHALALALKKDEVKFSWNLSSDSLEIKQYLSGQTFLADGEKGWHLILVDDYSIGWGKLAGGMMKNHYPKGLRINYK